MFRFCTRCFMKSLGRSTFPAWSTGTNPGTDEVGTDRVENGWFAVCEVALSSAYERLACSMMLDAWRETCTASSFALFAPSTPFLQIGWSSKVFLIYKPQFMRWLIMCPVTRLISCVKSRRGFFCWQSPLATDNGAHLSTFKGSSASIKDWSAKAT